jgi:hypothetical protein
VWRDTRLITPSTATDDLDLAGGLTDAFGNTLTFSRVKLVKIENLGTKNGERDYTVVTGEKLLVGGAGAGGNAWAAWANGDQDAKVTVDGGGVFLIYAPQAPGYAVTAGTGDVLRVALSGSGSNSIYYDIVIFGA